LLFDKFCGLHFDIFVIKKLTVDFIYVDQLRGLGQWFPTRGAGSVRL